MHRFCHYYQRIADQKRIRLFFNSNIDLPLVWADRVITAAVLDNLLSNATKYSKPGKSVKIQITAKNRWVECSVCDEGPGISETDQRRLFEPGSQLTPKPTGGEPSTGYGLAVAKEYIESLGGSIWCESTLGKGSCFKFRLPRYKGNNCEESEPRDELNAQIREGDKIVKPA